MVTELTRTFKNGFILTEAVLERIVTDVSEQFRQGFGDAPPKLVFTMRLRNGVTVSAYTLDRVLNEENLGDSQIVRLEIYWYAPRVLDPTVVSLVFKNASPRDIPDSVVQASGSAARVAEVLAGTREADDDG